MAGAGTERFHRAVPLLQADPELAAGLPSGDLAVARRAVVAPEIALEPGPWRPLPAARYGERPYAVLVVDGLLTREVTLADRSAAQLLGPGDVVSPWPVEEGLVPAIVEWTATAPTRLAVLDDRSLVAVRRWPSIGRVLYERLAGQAARASVHTAIAQLPRVDQRVLAIMWHLAERFGKVTPAGVLLPLRLTHEAIGRLAGAQRPTVTLALRDLLEAGAVERYGDSGWLLREGSQVDLAPELEPLAVGAMAVAATLGAVAPRQDVDAMAEQVALGEVDRLGGRIVGLREQLPEQSRYVSDLLQRCRETNARSAATRSAVSRGRSGAG